MPTKSRTVLKSAADLDVVGAGLAQILLDDLPKSGERVVVGVDGERLTLDLLHRAFVRLVREDEAVAVSLIGRLRLVLLRWSRSGEQSARFEHFLRYWNRHSQLPFTVETIPPSGFSESELDLVTNRFEGLGGRVDFTVYVQHPNWRFLSEPPEILTGERPFLLHPQGLHSWIECDPRVIRASPLAFRVTENVLWQLNMWSRLIWTRDCTEHLVLVEPPVSTLTETLW